MNTRSPRLEIESEYRQFADIQAPASAMRGISDLAGTKTDHPCRGFAAFETNGSYLRGGGSSDRASERRLRADRERSTLGFSSDLYGFSDLKRVSIKSLRSLRP